MVNAAVPKTAQATSPQKKAWPRGFESRTLRHLYPGVAQSGSASALGAEGRGFESLHPGQLQGRSLLISAVLVSLSKNENGRSHPFEWQASDGD